MPVGPNKSWELDWLSSPNYFRKAFSYFVFGVKWNSLFLLFWKFSNNPPNILISFFNLLIDLTDFGLVSYYF